MKQKEDKFSSHSFVLCLDYVVISPFIYFKGTDKDFSDKIDRNVLELTLLLSMKLVRLIEFI